MQEGTSSPEPLSASAPTVSEPTAHLTPYDPETDPATTPTPVIIVSTETKTVFKTIPTTKTVTVTVTPSPEPVHVIHDTDMSGWYAFGVLVVALGVAALVWAVRRAMK